MPGIFYVDLYEIFTRVYLSMYGGSAFGGRGLPLEGEVCLCRKGVCLFKEGVYRGGGWKDNPILQNTVNKLGWGYASYWNAFMFYFAFKPMSFVIYKFM